MFERKRQYGFIMAALLVVACSQNETDYNTVPEEPIAISFSITEDATTRAANGYTGFIDNGNNQLRYVGFGVFAGQNAENKPDIMYNQKVEFIFLADDADNGYWSYSPLKYWPISFTDLYFCAYAPYVETADGTIGITGITGMSDDGVAPYIDYTLSDKLDETVDLLWSYHTSFTKRETLNMKMYHALARLAVSVKLADTNTYKTSSNKVLIRQITLSTTAAAQKGRLKLNADNTETINAVVCHYPTWTIQPADIAARTVDIYNDTENNPTSYGIIAEEVRYIDGMPYNWQPDGLQKGVTANALCAEDHHQAYVYFIPNESGLSLTCTVYYTLMDDDGTTYNGYSTATTPPSDIASNLRGNRTYHLSMIINPTVPTP